jgi:hypothetical protein
MQNWECLIKGLFKEKGNCSKNTEPNFERFIFNTIQIKKPFVQQLINNPQCDFDYFTF